MAENISKVAKDIHLLIQETKEDKSKTFHSKTRHNQTITNLNRKTK